MNHPTYLYVRLCPRSLQTKNHLTCLSAETLIFMNQHIDKYIFLQLIINFKFFRILQNEKIFGIFIIKNNKTYGLIY